MRKLTLDANFIEPLIYIVLVLPLVSFAEGGNKWAVWGLILIAAFSCVRAAVFIIMQKRIKNRVNNG